MSYYQIEGMDMRFKSHEEMFAWIKDNFPNARCYYIEDGYFAIEKDPQSSREKFIFNHIYEDFPKLNTRYNGVDWYALSEVDFPTDEGVSVSELVDKYED